MEKQFSWMTRPGKILFGKSGITKGDLAQYYESIASYMLPLMKDHPVAMERFPNGINDEGFYQKDIPDYFPAWIKRVAIKNRDGTTTTYVLCQNAKTLVYLAYQAVITPHLLLSKADKIEYPDRMIFDLDPGEGVTFELIKKTALQIRSFLNELNITSFAMTTGSRGIHVVAPLKRLYTFDYTHAYARRIAQLLEQHNPERLTTTVKKTERKGKIFIDFIRNTFAHHAVAPYAVRAREHAPIATPLAWNELQKPELEAQTYTIKNIGQRLKKVGDVWADFLDTKNTLSKDLDIQS